MSGSESPSPTIAVVIVTYNSADLLADLIQSLPAGAGSVDWRLIVVDNDSHDESLAVVRAAHPSATIVQMGRNAGYAAAINAGVRVADDAAAVLVLNPDVRLEPECMPRLLTAVNQPGVGIAVPRLVDAHGVLIPSMRRAPSIPRAAADLFIGATRAGRIGTLGEVVTDDDAYASGRVTDWAEGSTLMISRRCLDAVGEWDERFFLYSEETEFALRAGDAGFATYYEPSASAVHLEGGSATSERLWPLVQVNKVRHYGMRHRMPATIVFWALVVAREAARAAMGRSHSRRALRRLLTRSSFTRPAGPWFIDG